MPPVFEVAAPGKWFYNHNIAPWPNHEGEADGYECDQVEVVGELTYKNVVRAVIRSRYDETLEFSIINDHNAFNLGVGDPEAKKRYLAFIAEVREVKDMVKALNLELG